MLLLRGLNMNWEDEFIKGIELIEIIPEPVIEYRLHYNENGDIYMCSMTNHPEHTEYLVVDNETYNNYFRYRIKNGVLKLIDTAPGMRVQLTSSTQGYAVVKHHAGILLENEQWTDVESYEAIN